MPPSYRLQRPWLLDLGDDCFDPALLAALPDPAALDALVTRAHPGIVVFPLFSAKFCQGLVDEARRFEAWCEHHQVPILRPDTIDHHHSFLVDLALDGDTERGFHVDDSEVTLNACLGSSFEGGDVYFRGERCPLHRQTQPLDRERYELVHRVGHGALHAGSHRHGVRPLRSGQRTNLIAWLRSSRLRRGDDGGCRPWCGAAAPA